MANLLFAPENLTRSGLKTPEGVSLHAGWYWARSGRHKRLVRRTGVKRELASLRLRLRAQRLRGAGLAGGRTKVDFDAVPAHFVLVFAPTHAVLARGAAHTLALPIDRKGFQAEGP